MFDLIPGWLYLLTAIIIILILFTFRKKKRYDIRKITIKDIDQMTGHEFEYYLFVLLTALGFEETYLTKKSRDFGADLIFVDNDHRKFVVQAKRLTEKMGLVAVQEVFAAKAYYDADEAIIITSTEQVSEPCRKLASATNVKIVKRQELMQLIRALKQNDGEEAQFIISNSNEEVGYTSTDSIEDLDQRRGMIQAGDYFIKL